MNTVWILLMVVSVVFSFLNGRLDAFAKSIFEGAKSAVGVSLFLLGIVSLWLGITKIIEDSGLIHRVSGLLQYPVRRLFSSGSIVLRI
jgi:spore maturation protein A